MMYGILKKCVGSCLVLNGLGALCAFFVGVSFLSARSLGSDSVLNPCQIVPEAIFRLRPRVPLSYSALTFLYDSPEPDVLPFVQFQSFVSNTQGHLFLAGRYYDIDHEGQGTQSTQGTQGIEQRDAPLPLSVLPLEAERPAPY